MIKRNEIDNVLPQLSKQISSDEIYSLIEERYTEIVTQWMPLQVEWMNGVYRTFYDPEKFMIVMHLLKKTFENYSENFVKLDFGEYFNQNEVEIKEVNVMKISKALNIPKETTRRKINQLEKLNVIKRSRRKIIIDRKAWPGMKPQDTIVRVSRFLSILSKKLNEEKKISNEISSKEIISTVEEYFSHVWKLYYDMQMPMLLNFKERFGDIESFHIWGICVTNQIFTSLKNDNSYLSKEKYLEKYLFRAEGILGINAMSISDISGIPRATVFRKLSKLVKSGYLKIDEKKHYLSTGLHSKDFKDVQKINLKNLSKFASRIYNLINKKENKF